MPEQRPDRSTLAETSVSDENASVKERQSHSDGWTVS